jgi:mRNA-degrading endonuclease toxin of MazEF toxin-antitoxin module
MKEYIKQFNIWNEQKKKLDVSVSKKPLYFKEREVWWISVGVNVGVEIDGKNELFERPVLILRKVSALQFYGLPLTSKDQSGQFYRLVHYGKGSGQVCLSQLRVFSTKRLLRKIDHIPQEEFDMLQNLIAQFFKGGRF